jgi:phytoene synthase
MPPENSLATGYAPRGTAWYYATLHLPSAQRLPLLALQAWWRAVRNIPHAVSDVGVASAKLAWWEVQVGLCRDGRPEHPLLVTLQPALHAAHVAPEPLLRALAQVEETLRQSRWMDWRGLQRHLEEGPGQIARVACQISGPPSTHSQNLDYACALGVALAQVGLVRDVGRDVRRGMIFFPIDDLAAHAVKARQLLDCEDSPQVRALLRHAAERARLALTAADALRPKDMGGCARPGMALSRMGHALLREMERENYDLLRQRITLTPTRMLWSAWRAK